MKTCLATDAAAWIYGEVPSEAGAGQAEGTAEGFQPESERSIANKGAVYSSPTHSARCQWGFFYLGIWACIPCLAAVGPSGLGFGCY